MHFRYFSLALLLSCLLTSPALAVPPPMTMAIDADDPSLAGNSGGPFGFMAGIAKNSGMLGDLWGVREGEFIGQQLFA